MATNPEFQNTENSDLMRTNEKRYLMDNTANLAKPTYVEGPSEGSSPRRKGSTESNDDDQAKIIIQTTTPRNWFFIEIAIFQFIYLIGVYGTAVSSHALYLDKACRLILNYSQEICNNLTDYPSELDEAQKIGNNYSLYVTLLGLVPAAITSIFISNWSDKYGRKLPIIFAVTGILLLDIGFLINGIYLDLPLNSILYFAIPSGLTGGYLTINTCVFSLISENSSTNARTFLHAIMEVILLISIPLGTYIGGQLYIVNGFKFVPIFAFVVGVHVTCILYALVRLSESRSTAGATFRTVINDFFSFANLVDSFRTCLKVRENYGRAQIWLLVTSMCVTSLGYTVPTDQILFYFCKKMYGWGTTHYSNVSTYVSLATIATLSSSTFLFTKHFHVRDALLGILGSLSLIAQNICRSMANQESIFFTSVALGVFGGFSDITVRSMISKIVSQDEMGKVFMLYSLLVCTTPVVGAIAATQIYNASLAFFPGLYFAIAAAWLLYPLGVFLWINYLDRGRLAENRHNA